MSDYVVCDACPGVEAEHHLCGVCMEDDKHREHERIRAAVEAERAAIVAHLRQRASDRIFEVHPDVGPPDAAARAAVAAAALIHEANDIERGAHRGDDE